jgi:hypothetical protein
MLKEVMYTGETKFARDVILCKKKTKILCNVSYILWHLVFKIHVTVKWHKLSNDQITYRYASRLQ